MALTIQRTATVYRLWDNDDLRDCFEAHAGQGWSCSLVCAKDAGHVVWAVRLQNGELRQVVAADLDQVVVSDGITAEALSVADYNTANPDNQIEDGS